MSNPIQTVEAIETGKRFSAVIVNYNGGDLLAGCVQSSLVEGIPSKQIFIVDNGSKDGSLVQIERDFTEIQIIRNDCNAGFARAVNQGLARVASEFSLLLNNDAQLQPGALRAFAEAFDTIPALAIAGGQLRYPDGRLQNAFAPFPTLLSEIVPATWLQLLAPHRFQRKSASTEPFAVDSVLGACIAVRHAVLPTLGLLDDDFFFFWEEIEWCWRARQLGYAVHHVPAAKATHLQGSTANRFRGPARIEYQRSKLTFFRKTQRRAACFCISTLLVLGTLLNACGNLALCFLTLFTAKKIRAKNRIYWYVLAWHLLARPASWGLPGKCPGPGSAAKIG